MMITMMMITMMMITMMMITMMMMTMMMMSHEFMDLHQMCRYRSCHKSIKANSSVAHYIKRQLRLLSGLYKKAAESMKHSGTGQIKLNLSSLVKTFAANTSVSFSDANVKH